MCISGTNWHCVTGGDDFPPILFCAAMTSLGNDTQILHTVNSYQEENDGDFSVCFVVIILFKLFMKQQ